MDRVAHIGPSIRIRGEVFSQEPLTIAGHVTGTIDLTGHQLTVTDSAHLDADIVAHTVVIGGNVNGKVLADRIVVSKTAIVAGEIAAPTLNVEDGAQVQGRFDVGKSTSVELTDAQQALAFARGDQVQARADERVARAGLARALGIVIKA